MPSVNGGLNTATFELDPDGFLLFNDDELSLRARTTESRGPVNSDRSMRSGALATPAGNRETSNVSSSRDPAQDCPHSESPSFLRP